MSFESDSQDSRDPNSPQWGYVKVRNPEEKLQYPAKDTNWNEYVMFVHDQDIIPIKGFDKKTQKIPARTGLECVMVPATLSIDCAQLTKQIEDVIKACDETEDVEIISELNRTLSRIKEEGIPTSDTITIPSKKKLQIPDQTTIWVALVVGPKK